MLKQMKTRKVTSTAASKGAGIVGFRLIGAREIVVRPTTVLSECVNYCCT